ncbi:MAG: GNAT family N-acetyltransferase [Clostridia bacterium]|nr:GNAT family N-acetyltransferase [Clostridia bacterium]
MEEIKIDKITSVYKIDKQSFLENSDEIIAHCTQIISSYEKKANRQKIANAKAYLYKVCSNLFLDGDAYFYLLKSGNDYVSFNIFSSHPNKPNSWIMEMVYTNKNLTNCGYAQKLMEASFEDMKKGGAKEVILSVSNKNEKSMHIQSKMQQKCKSLAVRDDAKTKFYLNLETFNEAQIQDEPELER